MANTIDNDYQTKLLFKQFVGVAAVRLDDKFNDEKNKIINSIFGQDIFVDPIPDPLDEELRMEKIDVSGDWLPSEVSSNPDTCEPSKHKTTFQTFAETYPDSKLEFYKDVLLQDVNGSHFRVWHKKNGAINIMQDAINYKHDNVEGSYLMRVKFYDAAKDAYIKCNMNITPLYWLFDNKSGFLQLYASEADLKSNASIETHPPKISFFKYAGKKGVLDLDIDGQSSIKTYVDDKVASSSNTGTSNAGTSQQQGLLSLGSTVELNFKHQLSYSYYDTADAGAGGNSNSKGFTGGVYDGRYLYLIPYHNGSAKSGQITRYDTTADFNTSSSYKIFDTATVGGGTNSKGFSGGVFDGQYLYLIPKQNADERFGQITRYDTTEDFNTASSSSYNFFDTTTVNDGTNSVGFEGGVFDGQYLYLIPNMSSINFSGQITRYDTTAPFNTTSSYKVFDTALNGRGTSISTGFRGGVFDGHYLYLIPNSYGQIARYDTTATAGFTDPTSYSYHNTADADAGGNSNSKGFSGGVFDGRYLYLIPNSYGQITRYDTTADFTDSTSYSYHNTADAGAGGDSNSKGFHGGVYDGRYLYLIPYLYGKITRYDTTADFNTSSSYKFFDTANGNANSKGFYGGVYDGRNLYLIPHYNGSAKSGQITRYDTGGTTPQQGIAQFAQTSTFYLDGESNIGIGTTDPSAKLDVAGNIKASDTISGTTISGTTMTATGNITAAGDINATGAISGATISGTTMTATNSITADKNITATNFIYLKGTSDGTLLTNVDHGELVGMDAYENSLRFYTNYAKRMTLDSGGNLDVVGDITSGGAGRINAPKGIWSANTAAPLRLQFDTPNLHLVTGGLDRLTILGDGKVGIGIDVPGQLLDVNGNMQVRGKLYFDGVTTVAIQGDAQNYLTFTTTNTERMRITNDGKVGIGLTNPSKKLDVGGDIKASGDIIANGKVGIGLTNPSKELDVGGDIKASGDIIANGKVGIGLTNPSKELDVDGDINASGTISGATISGTTISATGDISGTTMTATNSITAGNNITATDFIYLKGTSDGTLLTNVDHGELVGMDAHNNSLRFYTNYLNHMTLDANGHLDVVGRINSSKGLWSDAGAAPPLRLQFDDTELNLVTGGLDRLTILGDGKVGIGIDVPGQLLDVGGNMQVRGKLYFDGVTTVAVVGSGTWNYLSFKTSNLERMRIDQFGKMGIGTTGPSYPLHVSGYENVGQTTLGENVAYLTNTALTLDYWISSGSASISLKTEYGIWSAGAIVVSSDRRIKDNIVEVPDNLALQQVLDIECKYYEYKDKISKGAAKTIGFIAQQVKEVLPMAVSIQKEIIPNEMRIVTNISWNPSGDKYKCTIHDLSDNSGNQLYRFYVSNDLSGANISETDISNSKVFKKEICSLIDDPKSFMFDTSYNRVFIYGKQVDDFHILDKSKIFSLHHSAIQEMYKLYNPLIIENNNNKQKILEMETKYNNLLARIEALEN